MTAGKRTTDIVLALLLGLILFPVILAIALVILVRDGRPVLYLSERMKTPSEPFTLLKFRTMTTTRNDSGVCGGDKTTRITPTGHILRRTRLDELPQLLNILRGDLSFVGPRPPLRAYVEKHPEIYARVLRSRPGVTGLATLRYHRIEERLLSACRTAAETDAMYSRRCVPAKARLDMIWAANRTFCFDAAMMIETAARAFQSAGQRSESD